MFDRNYLRILNIDLSTRSFEITDRKDLHDYLGGVGLATKLLDENLQYDKDPLDPEQPIIFAIGPMSTIFPVVTKTVCMFRSPLTGELGESYAGGRLAMAMLYAGYDAIVIRGRADRPVYLSIGSRTVSIKKADPLWGANIEETGRYLREVEKGRGFRSIVRIGRAGEKQIRFACLNVDTYRHFGRLGAGAMFGAKHLKAMVVAGEKDYAIPPELWKEYRKVYGEIYKRVTKTEIMEKYHDLGTPVNVLKLNAMNALPTRNLTESSFDKAHEFSGESFAEERLIRKVACIGCPIGCIHVGQYRRLFGSSHEYETSNLPYDHELIFSLGTFLGTENKDDFFALLDKVEQAGMDAMSAGVLLGWMTEAYQQGLISEEEIGSRLAFGYKDGYLVALSRLVEQGNELYRILGLGVEAAAARYGGLEYAMALGKHEMTGYHTGYGAALGQAVGARHSHLDNGGYSMDQSRNAADDPEGFVKAIFDEEVARCVMNSLVICLFARNVYDLPTVEQALHAIGIERNVQELEELGRRIYRLKLSVKQKLGFDFKALRFPKRFFETQSLNGQLEASTMQDLLQRYIGHVDRLRAEEANA
ncbi:MAG: aldehyde ferredoxin oxidoreductase N-terminal domain-containing protein [Solirubrobacterales bacterium]